MTLFQCSFEVARSDVGVETGMSKVIFSSPTVSYTLCVSFFWGRLLQTMHQYMTLASLGSLCLWMEKQVLVPLMYLSYGAGITGNMNVFTIPGLR